MYFEYFDKQVHVITCSKYYSLFLGLKFLCQCQFEMCT